MTKKRRILIGPSSNILKLGNLSGTYSSAGVVMTVVKSQYGMQFKFNGTADGTGTFRLSDSTTRISITNFGLEIGKTYSINGSGITGLYFRFNGENTNPYQTSSGSVTAECYEENCYPQIIVASGTVLDNVYYTPVIVPGSVVPTEYIPKYVHRILKETTTGFRLVQDYAECGYKDLSTCTWSKNGTRWSTAISDMKYSSSGWLTSATFYSNKFAFKSGGINTTDPTGYMCANAINFYISVDVETEAELLQYLQDAYLMYQRTTDPTWGVTYTEALTSINRILVSEEE